MERKTNWIAIIISAIVGMFLGFLWYGYLFQSQWSAANGITLEGGKYMQNGTEIPTSATPMIFNTAAMILYPLLLNWLLGLTRTNTWTEGAKVGGAIGLMMASGITVGNMFANNPISLSVVDGSYSLVLFTLMGTILGGWTKKN
jgi:hypothetical protein